MGGGDTTIELDRLYEIINILGKRDCRMLLPLFETDPADDEGVQDIGQRGHHFSAMNTGGFDNDPCVQGDVLAYRLNGVDESLDLADHDDFSFGADGTIPNEPSFSLIIAVKFSVAINNSIITRHDRTALAEEVEYRFYTGPDATLRLWVMDELNTVHIARNSAVGGLVVGQWYVLIATYDGTRVNGGIRLFINGVRNDVLDAGAGAYTAMHNMAVVTSIGYSEGVGGALDTFFDGDVALPAITGRRLMDGGVAEGAPAAPFSDVARLTRLYQEVLGI